MPLRIAVLDDYQNRSPASAPWDSIDDAELTVFNRHLGDDDGVASALAPFDVVVCLRERTRLPAAVIDRLDNLQLIITAGLRNAAIDMQAAARRGVTVCGTQMLGYPAAELAWALVLALVKRIPDEHQAMREGRWQTTLAEGLNGRTLGLWGLGKLGQRVARMGQAFDMRVIAWSQNLTAEAAAEHGVERVDLDTLLAESDVLSIHVILSERSRGLIGAEQLARMKSSAYLVNTSRGPVVQEQALIEALRNGVIAGAGLDVYDVEPLPADHPIRSLPNVVLTGHTGYVTDAMYGLVYSQAVENILAWRRGEPLRVLNAD